jgi:tetratricopeptide (TPR) repeat protein
MSIDVLAIRDALDPGALAERLPRRASPQLLIDLTEAPIVSAVVFAELQHHLPLLAGHTARIALVLPLCAWELFVSFADGLVAAGEAVGVDVAVFHAVELRQGRAAAWLAGDALGPLDVFAMADDVEQEIQRWRQFGVGVPSASVRALRAEVAIATLRGALAARAWNRVAALARRIGQLGEARADVLRALPHAVDVASEDLGDTAGFTLLQLFYIEKANRAWAAAIRVLDRIDELLEAPAVVRAHALRERGFAYLQLRRFEDAHVAFALANAADAG